MESVKETVVITGISGYVGSQVCKKFLESGKFKVRGTVRSTKNPEKIEPLKKAFGALFDELELVEADLVDEESIINACEGQTYVVHTASPYSLGKVKNEDQLIKPAVAGTLAALKGAQKHKAKRVVITSSTLAICRTFNKKQTTFTNEDWTNTKKAQPYEKSKTLAEKAAWDFVKNLPEGDKFELVTINPGLILGPTLTQVNFQSGDVLKDILTGKYSKIPDVELPVCDVRDVAQAHLNAILIPEAAGIRFMMVGESLPFLEIAKILKEKYGEQFPNCGHKQLPRILCRIGSVFDKQIRQLNSDWGLKLTYNSPETTGILQINYTSIKQSILDMVPTLLENG